MADHEGPEQKHIADQQDQDQSQGNPVFVPKQNRRDVDQQAICDRIQHAPIATLSLQPSRKLAIQKVS